MSSRGCKFERRQMEDNDDDRKICSPNTECWSMMYIGDDGDDDESDEKDNQV